MNANGPRHVAIERHASRSADFALREFEFRIIQRRGVFRNCVPLRHEDESRVTEEVVLLVLLNRAGRMPALPEKGKI
jgi:hypothetical protein